jgi:GNAT superfamily N-acetyltransferase
MPVDPPEGRPTLTIRALGPADVPAFLDLVQDLADYERLPGPDEAARARLAHDALSDTPPFRVLLAQRDGRSVGYAVFLLTYSTFLALPTLYIEDIFVLPEERRAGTGRALMQALAREATRRGCGRMDWQVLDWNRQAVSFYEALGARRIEEWQTYRLDQQGIARLSREPAGIDGI